MWFFIFYYLAKCYLENYVLTAKLVEYVSENYTSL